MNIIQLSPSTNDENVILQKIYQEAKPYFMRVEGREPLPPLVELSDFISGVPIDAGHCWSIYYLERIIGYLWVMEDSATNFYLLHFYIQENERGLGFGRLAMAELEKHYRYKKFQTAELLVSGQNYLGLRFWQALGFEKLLHVYQAGSFDTSSIELELQKDLLQSTEEKIHLLPVTAENSWLGDELQVTDEQEAANLVLAVPEAIKAAFTSPFAQPYFICLANQVIGFTSLVFDETIPTEELQNWLWQLMIDQQFQNKGYAVKAIPHIIECFKKAGAFSINLSTKPTNHKAINLYQQFGFELTGEMNGTEIILQKNLTD